MTDYRVNLDVFAGPLDLLLYLVNKNEVDIYDIPIAQITDQYLHYIEMLKRLDIDLASDFLVMAATLMQIKSAMLLPKVQPQQLQNEDLTDPRTELVHQLLEYKKFKDAANLLEAVADKHRERFSRPDSIIERLKQDFRKNNRFSESWSNEEGEIDIEQVSVWDLLEAFDGIIKATSLTQQVNYIQDDTPIDLYQIEILRRLQKEGPLSFKHIFQSATNRSVMIGLFLALLELIRENLVWAGSVQNTDYEQSDNFDDFYLWSLTDEPACQAVQKALLANEDRPRQTKGQEPSKKPPIPISELPSKSKPIALVEQIKPGETQISQKEKT